MTSKSDGFLENIIATAYCSGKVMPSCSATLVKNFLGIDRSSPEPSPVLPSAATAPLCIIRDSAVTASSRFLCEGVLSIDVSNPNPQLSLNEVNKSLISQPLCKFC